MTDAVGFGLESELTLDGITHLRTRDLDPTLGRFTTRDPLDGIDATPTVANRFHYAGNDPINASDPLGLFVVTDKGLVLSGYCEGAELFGADIGCAAAAMAQPIADFHAGVLHTLVGSVTFGVADSRSVLGLFNAEDKVDYSSRYFMAGQLIAAVVEIGTGAAGAIRAVSAARNAIRARSLARAGNALDDDAARHIDNIADGGRVTTRPGPRAEVGWTDDFNYRQTFLRAHPNATDVHVHHAIEQAVLDRYPGLFAPNEIHSLQNLRGIPTHINPELHLSEIRIRWNRFYRNNPNPTREEVLDYASLIDMDLGYLFNPPVA